MALSNKRMGFFLSVLGAGAAGCFVAGCGVQVHPTVASASGGAPAVGAGTGGQIASSGGAPGSGGTNQGSGGTTIGGGGSGGNTGSGGQSTTGSGGTSAGSGGRSTGSGGASTATGGSPGTGGANTTVGVTINGKFVPKEKAVAFIHFGHSNMRGYAVNPTSVRPYFYDTVDGLWSYRGTFALAKEPTAPEGTATQTQAGPGMAILHSALAARKAGSDVQFISIGYGRGSVTTVDYAKSGSYYPVFMNWANQLKGKVTFGGIVIMLGITDAEHLPTAQVPGFNQRVAQIVSDIRTDLGEPNLPVLFCDYEAMATGDLAPTSAVGKAMIPLIKMLPTMISKLVLVPTDGLAMEDNHHFNLQGHKDWANRVIMLMQSNGWFLW